MSQSCFNKSAVKDFFFFPEGYLAAGTDKQTAPRDPSRLVSHQALLSTVSRGAIYTTAMPAADWVSLAPLKTSGGRLATLPNPRRAVEGPQRRQPGARGCGRQRTAGLAGEAASGALAVAACG